MNTVPYRSLSDIVAKLEAVVTSDMFDMVVRRDHVLSDALKRVERSSFDPTKKLHDGVYFKLGQLMAMALVHGGSPVRLLCQSVFNYVVGMKPFDIIVDINEIPETGTRLILKEILSADSTKAFHNIIEKHTDLLLGCGIMKFSTLELSNRVSIVQSVALQRVILETLGELTQFYDGLQCLGVGAAIAQYPEILKDFFVLNQIKLTADGVREIFKDIKFSEVGSNARAKEEEAYMYFLDYLDMCEKSHAEVDIAEIMSDDDLCDNLHESPKTCQVSLSMVMTFFTGAREIPPSGYDTDPSINFSTNTPYPTSSTCALQLTLPTSHCSFDSFKTAMDTGFLLHGGFGLS